jgi:hypothetical protein
MTAEKRAALLHATRWLKPSWCYDIISSQIEQQHCDTRMLITPDIQRKLFDVRKLEASCQAPLAYCNGYVRLEEKDEGDRLRVLFEPRINDIIKADHRLATTTRYARRADTRRHVANTSGGRQFDYAAWFDQIPLHTQIRRYFGVALKQPTDELGYRQLPVLPMGYRPSCEVAEAITEAISDVGVDTVGVGTCVDNILFTGDEADTDIAAQRFLTRSDQCGARVKDRAAVFSTSYAFLGEVYNHVSKTRALTERTQNKCRYIAAFLATGRQHIRLRQLAAIIGVLLYAADTLRLVVGKYHFVMRYYATQVSQLGGQYNTVTNPPKEILRAIHAWAVAGGTNTPVEVWRSHEHHLTLYVDASAIGWAAISIHSSGSVVEVARNWTAAERAQWNVSSSVAAEAVAVANAVAVLVTATPQHVVIYTDHAPLVFATAKTFGAAYSYSWLCARLGAYTMVDFDIRHITGVLNPADKLSRTKFTNQSATTMGDHTQATTRPVQQLAAYMPVTRIGFAPIRASV